jgi:cysteine desulfurase
MKKELYGYFDYAAATPMFDEAAAAMQPFFSNHFYNASAIYLKAKANRNVIEESRHKIAKAIGAKPTEIVFTAGGTEANNLAIHGIMNNFRDCHVVTSAIEHDSVLDPATTYNHSVIPVDKEGFVMLESLKNAITPKTVLLSVMYANNEIGSIQSLQEIAAIIHEERRKRIDSGNTYPLFFHTDACQATNYLDMQVSRLGIDLLSINAGKIYGPKQCGALYIKTGVALKPLLLGGGQEWNLRSGTENIANIVAFAVACEKVRSDYQEEADRIIELREQLIERLSANIPTMKLNGPLKKRRLANNVHVTIPGIDNERLLMELDETGFMIASGSACNASSDEPSHVLKAIGLSDDDARSSIRITLGRYTTVKSIDELADTIIRNIPKS